MSAIIIVCAGHLYDYKYFSIIKKNVATVVLPPSDTNVEKYKHNKVLGRTLTIVGVM